MVVIQEEETGCGVASVANIVGKSYAEIKHKANSIGIHASDEFLYSDTQYVRRLLSEYSMKVSQTEAAFESWKQLPDKALLAIKYHQENGQSFWHWVVYKRENGQGFVLDSAAYLKKNVRTDFENMEPKWFISIET